MKRFSRNIPPPPLTRDMKILDYVSLEKLESFMSHFLHFNAAQSLGFPAIQSLKKLSIVYVSAWTLSSILSSGRFNIAIDNIPMADQVKDILHTLLQ